MRLHPIVQFGDFHFDPEAPLLTRGSRSLDLSPKALQVLAVLVRNPGRVVSKDDLLNIVWPDTVVEEGNLAVHIFALRKALRTGATTAEYIETVPKRGYRFVAPLSPVLETGTAASTNRELDRCGIAAYYVQQQTVDGCRRAAAEYRECLKSEPGNAKARAGLANTLLLRFVLGDLSRDDAVPRAKALLQEASRIDSACADVHVSRSRLLCLGEWQWESAQEELEYALELAGNDETRSIVWAWQGCSPGGTRANGGRSPATATGRRSLPSIPVHCEILSRGALSGARLFGMRGREPERAPTSPALLAALSGAREGADRPWRLRPGQAVLPPLDAALQRAATRLAGGSRLPRCRRRRQGKRSQPSPSPAIAGSAVSMCHWFPSLRSMPRWETRFARWIASSRPA